MPSTESTASANDAPEIEITDILTSIHECALAWIANDDRGDVPEGWDKAKALMLLAPALTRTLRSMRDRARDMRDKRNNLTAEDWDDLLTEIVAATTLLNKMPV